MNVGKSTVRLVVALLVVASVTTLAAGYATADRGATGGYQVGEQVAPPREGVTVVATDSNSWLGRGVSGPRSRAELLAIGPGGRLVYVNDSHTRYWDVDPVPGTRMTVQYVAADHLPVDECGGETACTRNVVERVNLSTGETTRLFGRVTPGKHSTRWHDADRLDEDHLVVADIATDRVFVVNTTSDLVTWSWSAQNAYDVAESGGPFPSDWTHLNDVEVLDDGRIMASVRNHDQVVFLKRGSGRQANWTLGSDGAHEVLYEQHNPDYIPRENGGPAVVVADSENNRLVEYQRVDGAWQRTWRWSDGRLQWPRDADRLPNGHTLVTDSNGDRVFELNRAGEVVWQSDIAFPYEAERLGTGDESAGGPSARQAGLAGGEFDGDAGAGIDPGTAHSSRLGVGPVSGALDWATSGPWANAVAYVLPVWMGAPGIAATIVLVLTLLTWAVAEAWWSPWTASLQGPVSLERRR